MMNAKFKLHSKPKMTVIHLNVAGVFSQQCNTVCKLFYDPTPYYHHPNGYARPWFCLHSWGQVSQQFGYQHDWRAEIIAVLTAHAYPDGQLNAFLPTAARRARLPKGQV
jgi:hypothetical protein